MAFLSQDDLTNLKFKTLGDNVLISDKCSIYNPQNIVIGDNVRIDDFCILSAGQEINIGNNIHIACYSSLIGYGNIIIEDFSSISGRVSIYSSTDDYMGLGMTNPMIPIEYRRVTTGTILIKKHSIIGPGSIILPHVTLNTGAAISALSLIMSDCEEFSVYRGTPAIKIGKRHRKLLELEKEFNIKYGRNT